jgi:hypothetical protein
MYIVKLSTAYKDYMVVPSRITLAKWGEFGGWWLPPTYQPSEDVAFWLEIPPLPESAGKCI